MPFIGNGAGGSCEIQFGPGGKPVKIDLAWRTLKKIKPVHIFTPAEIISSIRRGDAIQGRLPANIRLIDWASVHSITISGCKLCYYGGSPVDPSPWLMPFVALWTTVGASQGNVDLEIDTPATPN